MKLFLASFNGSESLESELGVYTSVEELHEAIEAELLNAKHFEGATTATSEEIALFLNSLDTYESYLRLYGTEEGYEKAINVCVRFVKEASYQATSKIKEKAVEIKILDVFGNEIEINTIILKHEDDNVNVLGGFSTGDGEFIPFSEWEKVWYEDDVYSHWYGAIEYRP